MRWDDSEDGSVNEYLIDKDKNDEIYQTSKITRLNRLARSLLIHAQPK